MNLDELERLYKAATPGEWDAPTASCYANAQEAKNACFIAALHNAFPALLALARDGEKWRAEQEEKWWPMEEGEPETLHERFARWKAAQEETAKGEKP